MYISEYDFGKKNFDSVKKVAEHFCNVGANTPSLASDMGVSGSFMSGLLNLGVAQVAGYKEQFVCVDERQQLYRRYEAKLYVLTITAHDFWNAYCKGVERVCNENKQIAENHIAHARFKLAEVQDLLKAVDEIRI